MNECLIPVIPNEIEFFSIRTNLLRSWVETLTIALHNGKMRIQRREYNNYLLCAGQLVNWMVTLSTHIRVCYLKNVSVFVLMNLRSKSEIGKWLCSNWSGKSLLLMQFLCVFLRAPFQCKFWFIKTLDAIFVTIIEIDPSISFLLLSHSIFSFCC